MTLETQDEATAAVLHYLKKMGYRQTEQLFREEAHIAGLETLAFELRNDQDSNISHYLLFSNQAFDFSAYEEVYDNLRKWIYESLDAYRDQLLLALYPLYVHLFLDLVAKGAFSEAKSFRERFRADHLEEHGDELNRLQSITDVAHLKENPLSVAFRTNKYNINMSAYAFQLLMNFLQDNAALANVLLLKIINQYINIRVLVSGKGAGAMMGLTGVAAESTTQTNGSKIHWGAHPVDPAVEGALQQRAKMDARLNELLQGPLAHLKRVYASSSLNAPSSEKQIPHIPITFQETNAEIDRLRNLARRANLSTAALPSICCYTLHNTYDGVVCITFSPSANLMATGNRDSYIDVWSLTHEQLRSVRPSTELAAMDISDFSSLGALKESEGSSCRRLIGHSGPVYACRFMPPEGQRLLVSASQDGTARLWSLDLFTTLVVFRGHNLPIWDIDVAPFGVGPYFVTASADRTARLWSTEHIQPLRIFAGHLSDVEVVRFHPNGNYVITGSADKTVRVWDVQSGACVRLFSGHLRTISALTVSPDGRYLVSGDKGGQLKFWDLAEGRCLCSIQIYGKPNAKAGDISSSAAVGPIWGLELDRDGRLLTVSGADNTIRIFDMIKCWQQPGIVDENALLVSSYLTKQTPIIKLQFTTRNVLLAAGPFRSDD